MTLKEGFWNCIWWNQTIFTRLKLSLLDQHFSWFSKPFDLIKGSCRFLLTHSELLKMTILNRNNCSYLSINFTSSCLTQNTIISCFLGSQLKRVSNNSHRNFRLGFTLPNIRQFWTPEIIWIPVNTSKRSTLLRFVWTISIINFIMHTILGL